MALFLHSVKCVRYLRNISKLIQINENKRFLCLTHVPNVLETKERTPTDFYAYQTSEHNIHLLIKQMDKRLRFKKLLDKNLIDEIIQCIQIEGKIDSSQALSVLHNCNLLIQCTPEQRNDLVNTVWKLFDIYNIQKNVSYYNTLLDIYLENKYEFSPLDILSDMKKQFIEPNGDTYKKLLKYYCMKGNMSKAMTVFQCMKDENHVLTVDVFNSFILGYTQVSDLKSALNVLQIMEKINLTPTNTTYTALMCAYATYNDIESIQKILSKCQTKNITFTNEDILNVIYTLIANKNVDYVNTMLDELTKPFSMEELHFLAKIIDIKQEKIAMKIFYYFYSGIRSISMKIEYEKFFLNKLMYNKTPIGKILETCRKFYTNYDNKKIYGQAIFYAFKQNEDVLASTLLKKWKDNGDKLRPHYFWPFLIKFHKNHDIKGLLEYVKNMKEVYGVEPCISTVANYILPNILNLNMSTTFFLTQYNVPIETTRNAIVYYWLMNFKTKISVDYVVQHPCYYDDFVLKSKLKRSLVNTHDIDSYLTIAQNLYTETISGAKEKVSLDEKILDIMGFLQNNPTCISKTLQYLSKYDISISDNTYKILIEYQKADLTSKNLQQQLENLNEANDSSVKTHSSDFNEIGMMNKANEEMNIEMNNSTTEQLHSLTFSDPTLLLRNFLQLKTWNTATSNEINISIINKLFNQYSRQESKKILQKFIVEYPNCTMAKLALIYAKNLISVGDLNDAAELIKYTGQIIKVESSLLANDTGILLNEVALIGNDTILHKFFDILLQQKYIETSTNYLKLLIIVHVNQGNLRKALEIAEMLNNKYKHIPAFTQLTESIVLAKDTELLQDFINIAIKTYEQQYILGELILCFLKNDFEEEAKKLIQLFCTSNYNFAVIKNILHNYPKESKYVTLEKLLDFTIDYPNTKRFILYEYLAKIYGRNCDYIGGLNLLNRMKKEKVLPTSKLQTRLAKLLKHDKTNVPISS